jgi:branched-chain amino acid transport system substrate-binding protein
MYCLSPAIQTTPGSMVFSASIPTDDLLETVIRYFHGRGWNRLALLTTTDASGQDAERAFQRVLAMPEFAKMRIVAHDRFNALDISVAAQIERLRQAKLQALLAWTTGTAVGTIFRGLKQADYDLPVATSTGNELMSLINQFADEMPRELYFASGQGSARDVPGQDAATTSRDMAFFTTFREAWLTPDQAAETVWDASMIVSDALRHAGPEADAARVRDAIDQMSGYVGVDGTYDFVSHPQRGLPPDVAVMVRWDSAKKEFVAVSPPGG